MKLNEATIFFVFLAVGFIIVAVHMFMTEQFLMAVTSVYVVILSVILMRMGWKQDGTDKR